MSPASRKSLIGAALLSIAGAALAQEIEKPAAVNTDGMPPALKARIEAKAQQGQTAVIQYINRTRNIHNLRADQVIRSEPQGVEARQRTDESPKVAKSDSPQK